ncbi:MAG: ArsR family transcriptional regulator [Haloplanus sp.]
MGATSYSDEQLRLLSDTTNRELVAILDDADRPLGVETLAERLVDRSVTVVSTAEYDDRVERWRVSLHHTRLPKLAEAGLIEYDSETNTVDYPATPDVEWHGSATLTEMVAELSQEQGHATHDTGVITGQESISRYGRQLTAEAEDELFCLCATADFLTDDCVRSAEDALDRGVHLAVGSQDPAIRDRIREQLPAVTTWEPQLDWLNTPSHPCVGRLVFVDRRTVMLSILGEPDADGTDTEDTAVVGAGETHPLVILVRELLGARLDHLDYQSDDFRSEPFQ